MMSQCCIGTIILIKEQLYFDVIVLAPEATVALAPAPAPALLFWTFDYMLTNTFYYKTQNNTLQSVFVLDIVQAQVFGF
jgi:hypothetical protein